MAEAEVSTVADTYRQSAGTWPKCDADFGHSCKYALQRSNRTITKWPLEEGAELHCDKMGECLGLGKNRQSVGQR